MVKNSLKNDKKPQESDKKSTNLPQKYPKSDKKATKKRQKSDKFSLICLLHKYPSHSIAGNNTLIFQ